MLECLTLIALFEQGFFFTNPTCMVFVLKIFYSSLYFLFIMKFCVVIKKNSSHVHLAEGFTWIFTT